MISSAIILAGGEGRRLRPLTDVIPKPLILIKDKPILEYAIDNLKKHNINNIILSVGYRHEQIIDYFGDGSSLGVNITYSIENEPLGTGGAIKKAMIGLKTDILILWGDNLMDINYQDLFEIHKKNKQKITMVLTPVESVESFGVAKIIDGKVISFVEKPKKEDAPSNLINAGAVIIDNSILNLLPEGKSSVEKDIYEKLRPGEIVPYIHLGQWFPTDTIERLTIARENFKQNTSIKSDNL